MNDKPFHGTGLPGLIEPLTPDEQTSADRLLKAARHYLVPLRHEAPGGNGVNYSHSYSAGHFRALQPEERALLVRWALLHHAEAEDFGALHRTLRVFSGLSAEGLAEKLGSYFPQIFMQERGIRNFPRSYLRRFFKDNPCDLPVGENGAAHPQLQALLERHFGLTPLPCDRAALFADIRAQIEAYRHDEISLAALPTQFDAYRALKPKDESWSTISGTLFPDKKPWHLFSALDTGSLSPDIHKALQKHFGLDEGQSALLLRLPAYTTDKTHPLKFMGEYARDMTRPEVMRVFNHPERYRHFGGWLAALIDAAQQTKGEVGDKLAVGGKNPGGASSVMSLYCDGRGLDNKIIASFLCDRDKTPTGRPEDFNPLNLPADEEKGVIDDTIKKRFTELGRGYYVHVRPHISIDMAGRLLALADAQSVRERDWHRIRYAAEKDADGPVSGLVDKHVEALLPPAKAGMEDAPLHPALHELLRQAEEKGLRGEAKLSLGEAAVGVSYDVDGIGTLDAADFLRYLDRERHVQSERTASLSW